MTLPSPQIAAWSTAGGWVPGACCALAVTRIEPRFAGVVLSEGLDEPQDGERAQPIVLVDGRENVGDVEWPAVDDAREAAFSTDMFDQVPIWSGHPVFIT